MSLIGKKVGPYLVEAEIGQGGMATVYRASQPSLERGVAIKELRGDQSRDPSLGTRFAREAKYVAALAHQNIVHVYDLIERANAMYMVLELVDGVDLGHVLNRVGRLPPDIAALVALQAAVALEYAHAHGVVHRDFKPSNLMVTPHGVVKLMDFGIARDAINENLTRTGIAVGTPAYMSPEQIVGERVDFRSDIFSFGIVLYQMLTGVLPFKEDNAHSVTHAILRGVYTAPRLLYPDVPAPLQRIVQRCLENSAEARYNKTELLRHDIERFVARGVPLNQRGYLVAYFTHCQMFPAKPRPAVVDDKALARFARRRDPAAVNLFTALYLPLLRLNGGLFLIAALWLYWMHRGGI